MFRNVAYLLLAFFLPFSLSAQKPQELTAILESCPQDSCVRVEFSITALQGDSEVSDAGYVEIQDGLWVMKARGLEMYTDGSGTWIVDPSSKEVLIEPVWTYADLENFYKAFVSQGGRMDLKILSRTCSQKKPDSSFTPSFDSSWIITDLR